MKQELIIKVLTCMKEARIRQNELSGLGVDVMEFTDPLMSVIEEIIIDALHLMDPIQRGRFFTALTDWIEAEEVSAEEFLKRQGLINKHLANTNQDF